MLHAPSSTFEVQNKNEKVVNVWQAMQNILLSDGIWDDGKEAIQLFSHLLAAPRVARRTSFFEPSHPRNAKIVQYLNKH